MEFLRSKQQIVEQKLGLVNEVATKTTDGYQVLIPINVPKSLINAFVSKAKKENGLDPRENFGDSLLAELLVTYVASNFLNIESIPVAGVMGEKPTGEVQTTIQPEEIVQTPQPQAQIVQPGQPAAQTQEVPALQGQPTAEIQQENNTTDTDADLTNEIFGFSAEEKAKKKEDTIKAILAHPAQSKVYNDYLKNNPERAEKMVTFLIKNPGTKYFQWDDKKNDFAPKGVYSVASGEGLSGK